MTTLRIADGRVLRPDMTVEKADVLVDQDTGDILAVGDGNGNGDEDKGGDEDRDEIDDGDEDDIIDAEGCLVIPGLVNAHTHVAMTLFRGYADDKPLDAWLQEDIWPVEAELTAEDVRAGARLGMLEMIRSGTTCFGDMYFYMPEVAAAVEASGMRALLGYGSITVAKDDTEAHEQLQQGLEFATEYDGAADGRVSTAFMPHSLTTVDEAYLREYVPKARDAGLPIHFHANETENEVDPIVEERSERPLAYADDVGMLGEQDFLAHGVHVDKQEMELLAERETAVVHCPASNMKLASGMAPVQALLDHGVTVGLGTDGAASNNDLSLFDEMRDAAMVGKLATGDASAVDAPTVVEMATAGGCAALGIDSGRIEPGANADIAVLDLDAAHLTPEHDLVSHLVYAASAADVRHTVCDGSVLMRDRTVLTLDEQTVITEASEHAHSLIDRAAD